MRFVKGALVYIICPIALLGIGFYTGMQSIDFFYPGRTQPNMEAEILAARENAKSDVDAVPENGRLSYAAMETPEPEAVPVQAVGETLCADTEYVLEETDIIRETVVETSWRLPQKYVGMNREQFIQAMEIYESSPPLAELERGFVSLEVLTFSRERVTVQMNYQYVQPGNSFYLAVMDNEVVVYLEDMETIYINTGIKLETLPEKMQMEIIQMLWVEDEEKLYDFLETYSS